MYSVIHFVLVLLGTLTGFAVSQYFMDNDFLLQIFPGNTMAKVSILFGTVGYLFGTLIAALLNQFIKSVLSRISIPRMLPQLIGVASGLVVINLFLIPFYVFTFNMDNTVLNRYIKLIFPLIMNIAFAFFGGKAAEKFTQEKSFGNSGFLVDTNILIDGRIEKIAGLNFFDGRFIVPDFVLGELQTMGDSHDEMKRKKGRRGLEILETLKKKNMMTVMDSGKKADDEDEQVDMKIIEFAKEYSYIIMSNDYNLIKKAQVLGVKTLFLKDFEEALSPLVSYGDEFRVTLVRKGKEPEQAVGYLEDGTMVVAQNGKAHIGKTVPVIVDNIVGTSAGKIIFVNVKEG